MSALVKVVVLGTEYLDIVFAFKKLGSDRNNWVWTPDDERFITVDGETELIGLTTRASTLYRTI
jgi:hypothetical protein